MKPIYKFFKNVTQEIFAGKMTKNIRSKYIIYIFGNMILNYVLCTINTW
jgi:hypothetical protein